MSSINADGMPLRILATWLGLLVSITPFSPALAADASPFRDVHVVDFQSDEPQACTAADVDVDAQRAAAFFRRARKVSYRAIHDHYNTFPCQALGTMRLRGQRCTWSLNAGLYATVNCAGKETHYACDSCQDLLTPPAAATGHDRRKP